MAWPCINPTPIGRCAAGTLSKNRNFGRRKGFCGERGEYLDMTTSLEQAGNPWAEVARLQHQVQELTAKVEWYEAQIRLARARQFGASHEHSDTAQLHLFNEAEQTVASALEASTDPVATPRPKKPPGHRDDALAHLPVERIEYHLPESDQVCTVCQGPLHAMSAEVRRELQVIPAQVKIIEHVQAVYACRQWEREALTTPIRKAPMPRPIYPGSLASASLLAHTLHQKYTEGLPLYRQAQEWARLGIPLSRQTLANWVVYAAHEWLRPLYRQLRQRLVERDILHADETTVQVLREDGRPAERQSYMWLYRTGPDSPAIVLYEYQRTRAHEHPQAFLKGFQGYLQVDGYAGYHGLPDVRLVGCWAHARRKFTDVLKSLPAQDRDGPSATRSGLEFCNRLFAIERDLKDVTPAERLRARQERSRPVLAAFAAWLQEQTTTMLPKSALGEAVTYCRNQWTALEAFLEDGRLAIDNNRAERAIKPFVMGRNYVLQPVMC